MVVVVKAVSDKGVANGSHATPILTVGIVKPATNRIKATG